MVNTYANRVLELRGNFKPAHHSFISKLEMEEVKEILGLSKLKTELELRNMRDMVVLIFGRGIDEAFENEDSKKAMDLMDTQSAVVAVIDKELWDNGYPV